MGLGIGRIAIIQAINLIKDEFKLKTIKLNVRKNNQRAINCYERCGFTIVREGTKINEQGQIIQIYEMKYCIE